MNSTDLVLALIGTTGRVKFKETASNHRFKGHLRKTSSCRVVIAKRQNHSEISKDKAEDRMM
jgi:hypothetical protein